MPIVRETGGLRDTVLSYNKFTDEGNGFSFFNYNAHDMLHTVRRAVHYYKNNREVWYKLIVRGMTGDYSWHASANKYLEMYDRLLALVEAAPEAEAPAEVTENPNEAPVVEETVVVEEAPVVEAPKKKAAPRKKASPKTEAAAEAKEEAPKKRAPRKKKAEEAVAEAPVEEPKKKTTRKKAAVKAEDAAAEAPKKRAPRKKKETPAE